MHACKPGYVGTLLSLLRSFLSFFLAWLACLELGNRNRNREAGMEWVRYMVLYMST